MKDIIQNTEKKMNEKKEWKVEREKAKTYFEFVVR
jgi:hypothetical protein